MKFQETLVMLYLTQSFQSLKIYYCLYYYLSTINKSSQRLIVKIDKYFHVCAVCCANWDAMKLGCRVIELDGQLLHCYQAHQRGHPPPLLDLDISRQAQLQGICRISIANRIPI